MNNKVSTASLKHIAILSMLIDHLTQHLYLPIAEAKGVSELAMTPVLLVGSLIIGRIAFVLFAYTCSLSVMYSKSIRKYLLRLFIFCFISEIPYDLSSYGTFFDLTAQNVFFTLFLGTLTIVLCNLIDAKIKNNENSTNNENGKYNKELPAEILKLIVFIMTMMCAYVLNSDYGAAGVLLIYLMYRNRADSKKMIIFAFIPFMILLGIETWFKETGGVITDIVDTIFTCLGCAITEIAGLIGFNFISNYNHERGKQLNKWLYYIFYPAHLLIIAIIVKIVVN